MRAIGLLLFLSLAVNDTVPSNEAQMARISAQIEKAGPKHPWAGSYYQGDGLGENATLLLSPTRVYWFENHGCMGLYARDHGLAQETDGVIRFPGADSYELKGKSFHVVPWGERVYLIADDEFIGFINDVNRGWEPRYRPHGFRFLRDSKKLLLASGKPGVPEEYKPYLLDHVVDADVVAAGVSGPLSANEWDKNRLSTEVTIGVGRKSGLLPGMAMMARGNPGGDATISRVYADSSTAVLVSTVPPRIGATLSTRFEWRRTLAPPDQPFRVRVARSSGFRAKPFNGAAWSPYGEASVDGARAAGFAVKELARVEIAAVDSHLMGAPLFDEIKAAMKPLGANVYVLDGYPTPDLPGPWTNSQKLIAYRVDFEGGPVMSDHASISFMGKDPARGWERTRAAILLDRNEFERAERRLYGEVSTEFLHLTKEQAAGWTTLRIEDMSPDQRASIKERASVSIESGRLTDALHAGGSKWSAAVSAEVEGRMKKLRSSDPKAYDEYLELKKKAWPW